MKQKFDAFSDELYPAVRYHHLESALLDSQHEAPYCAHVTTADSQSLGPFRARRDGNEVEGIQSNKIRGLLAYLAVEADAVHSRACLATLLWPDLDELRAAICAMR
ncbi:MAG: hypothetical protein H6644_11525 [Caldilineaceae bacterium]|nr:hypothetical protein [Caldilineaceae bacterium]